MKKFLIFALIGYLSFIALMPKENLYYTLVNKLKQERVVITQESLSDNLISLKGKNALVFYDGIESIQAEKFTISSYLLFNKVKIFNVSASEDLKKMFGFSADFVKISYVIWNYKSVDISAIGDFGKLRGDINLETMEVKLMLEPSEEFQKSPLLNQYFKKSEEGYIYESKIK